MDGAVCGREVPGAVGEPVGEPRDRAVCTKSRTDHGSKGPTCSVAVQASVARPGQPLPHSRLDWRARGQHPCCCLELAV